MRFCSCGLYQVNQADGSSYETPYFYMWRSFTQAKAWMATGIYVMSSIAKWSLTAKQSVTMKQQQLDVASHSLFNCTYFVILTYSLAANVEVWQNI